MQHFLQNLSGTLRSAHSKWRFATAALALATLGLGTAHAQTVDTYTLAASSGTYTQLTGGTNVAAIQDDDELSAPIPLGFNFTFDGVVYTQVVASSNGWLSFNTAATSSEVTNNLDLGPASIRPLVAPLWDDLDGVAGTASYATTGTAPNRVFTFEWRNWEWRYTATAPGISFQARLYEGSNRVEFVYRQEAGALDSPTASIGLSGIGTGAGSFLSLSDATAAPTASSTTESSSIDTKPATGQIYAFTPGTPAACPAVRNVAFSNVTGTGAQISFVPSSSASSYTVTYTPQGGTATTVTPAPTASPITLTGLTPATQYTVSITANCGGGLTSTAATGTFTTSILNDDPAGAIVVPITATCTSPTNGTNAGATTTTPNGYTNPGTGCGIATSPKDVWFKFTTSATGPTSTFARIVVTGNPAGSVRVFSSPGGAATGPFTQVGCAAGTTNNTVAGAVDLAGLTPNTTYYIAVAGYGSADTQGAFTICVTNPPACGNPINATIVGVTSNSAQVNFTPGNGNISYTVTYTPQGGTATTVTPAPTASPITLTGLTPGTQYTVTIQANCAGGLQGQALTGAFTTTTVANDNICGAIQLPLGTGCTPTNATNAAATTSPVQGYTNPPTSGCGIATSPKDVWFRVTTAATGAGSTSMNLTVTGNPAGSIRVFSAASCTSPLTQVACKGGTTNNTSAGSVNVTGLTPGTTYYVSVAGYGSADTQGAFTICASNTLLSSRHNLPGGEVDVYPNPTSTGQLTVKLSGAGAVTSAQAELINTLGQVVTRASVALRNGAAEQQISTQGLSRGVYTLHLRVGDNTVTRKVVVE